MSPGWNLRLNVLRRDVERHVLEPLRTHAWTATIEQEVENGEYLIVGVFPG